MSDDEKLPNIFHRLMARMMEKFAEHRWESLLRSYVLAGRDEQKARLRTIHVLFVELDKITAVSVQATDFHRQIIEAIICGDWKEAVRINGWLGDPKYFGGDEHHEKLWENFRAVVLVACAEAERRKRGDDGKPD